MVRWCWVNFQCRVFYNLDCRRARTYCACSRCGWGLLGHFTLIYPFSPLSPSLWEAARYILKNCLEGTLTPKQTTNHPPDYPLQTYELEQNKASKQKVGNCDKTTLQIFHFTVLNTYVSLIFHALIQPKISSGSEENSFVVFVILSNSGNLGFSTRPNFTICIPGSQVMLHVKFQNCRSSNFIGEDVWIFVFKC